LNQINHAVFGASERQQAIALNAHCNKYRTADNGRAIWEVFVTLVCLGICYSLIWLAIPYSTLLALVLAIPCGLFLTRIFAIQHDCGHGSFFSSTTANDWAGRLISILTFTPYENWRKSHAYHHANSGNLETRGIGDVETITVAEFEAMSLGGQRRYRITRNPLVALVLGPILYFFVMQRLAIASWGETLSLRDRLKSILALDLALLAFYGGLGWLVGFKVMLMLVVPAAFVGAWTGGFLFFVQHQFEHAHWKHKDEWDVKVAALKGSSFLILPKWMDWLTCNITHHHIHHLVSKVPSYRLPECLAGHPDLPTVAPRLTLPDALRSTVLGLFDERTGRLISFKDYDKLRALRLQEADAPALMAAE
jgi:acyl-lipid omega-6 desaturase (Delta-12 desaturase)